MMIIVLGRAGFRARELAGFANDFLYVVVLDNGVEYTIVIRVDLRRYQIQAALRMLITGNSPMTTAWFMTIILLEPE